MTTVATRTPTDTEWTPRDPAEVRQMLATALTEMQLRQALVEEPTGPAAPPPMPKPTYVPNPYSFHMRAAFALTCGSGGATVWAAGHDNPYAPLVMGLTLLLAAATTGLTIAFNGREQALEVVTDTSTL